MAYKKTFVHLFGYGYLNVSDLHLSVVFAFDSSWDFSDGGKGLSNLSSDRVSSTHTYIYAFKTPKRISNRID